MSAKTEKLAHIIRDLATPILLEHAKEHGEEFWIVSILDIKISSEYSYADISVYSTQNAAWLTKFFAPLATELRALIGRTVNTRKIPAIRFKLPKNQVETNRVYDILRELEGKYDLSA